MIARPIRVAMAMLSLIAAGTAALPIVALTPRPAVAQTTPALSPAQLDQLLAPIALYPDPLVSQILMASTYPLEVVEAARWVQDPNNARLAGDPLAAALQSQDWDPSVKSLVPFPPILQTMSGRLDWMQQLGDAFLSQQGDVMDTVQRLRSQAKAAGTLRSTPQQTVSTADQEIVVEPTNPNAVAVPYYNPTVVYGAWPYPDYPPYAFPPPPGFVLGAPAFPGWWWGPVIEVSAFASFWGWDHVDWRRHDIHIDRGRFDHLAGPGRAPVGSDTWQHDPTHRRGVAYRDAATATRFGRPVIGSPEARRAFRGFESGPAAAPRAGAQSAVAQGPATARPEAQRSDARRPAGSPQATAPRPAAVAVARPAPAQRAPDIRQVPRPAATASRAQPTIFERGGSGAEARAQSERGHASQQAAAPSGRSAPPSRGGNPPPQQQQRGNAPHR
jgi:hypothetical protein